ncbi:MAG: RDD family protein [Pseudomonadota bacterium]
MNDYEFAGFWVRVFATLIDVVILIIVTGIPLYLIYGPEYWTDDSAYKGIWDFLIGTVFPIVVVVWMWKAYGATPGKMALNLKVKSKHADEFPTLPQSIGRYFAYILSALPLALGFFWVGFDKQKRGFHDMLAGTVVVKDAEPRSTGSNTDTPTKS